MKTPKSSRWLWLTGWMTMPKPLPPRPEQKNLPRPAQAECSGNGVGIWVGIVVVAACVSFLPVFAIGGSKPDTSRCANRLFGGSESCRLREIENHAENIATLNNYVAAASLFALLVIAAGIVFLAMRAGDRNNGIRKTNELLLRQIEQTKGIAEITTRSNE